MISNQSPLLILADTHVHFYDCFDVNKVLCSALKNFQNVAHKSDEKSDHIGVLFLTETDTENYFDKLYLSASSQCTLLNGPENTPQENHSEAQSRWIFLRTQESCSLIAQSGAKDQLVLIAGRQVVTAEKLEVLAIITDQKFEDGQPLEKTLDAIASSGGIPVLPWGVGKWLGHRGRLIDKQIGGTSFPSICLGDNRGRPVFWLRPSRFKQAENQGLRILPGTDPLPLPSEFRRPGSFGFSCQGSLNLNYPGQCLKEILLDSEAHIQPYGCLENPLRFVRNQLMIRLATKR